MTIYKAVYVIAGGLRQVTFEAESPEEAKGIAEKFGVGITGEKEVNAREAPVKPEAYDIPTAGIILSGNPLKPVSRSTIRRLEMVGKLTRLPHTSRFLITRSSLERYCSHQS